LLNATAEDHKITKITDLGLASFVMNKLATTACGTSHNVALEIIAGKG
jgi:serine/threonine protein kinase